MQDSEWLARTVRRVQRLLSQQRSAKFLEMANAELQMPSSPSFQVIARVRSTQAIGLTLRIEGYSMGNTWPLSYWLETDKRSIALALAARLAPLFGKATATRHRDGDPVPPKERLALDHRSNGWSRVGTELNYMVSAERPASSLLIADVAYFFDRALRLGAGISSGAAPHGRMFRRQRLLSIPGPQSMVSRYACPDCAFGLQSYVAACDRCGWPRRTREVAPWDYELADT